MISSTHWWDTRLCHRPIVSSLIRTPHFLGMIATQVPIQHSVPSSFWISAGLVKYWRYSMPWKEYPMNLHAQEKWKRLSWVEMDTFFTRRFRKYRADGSLQRIRLHHIPCVEAGICHGSDAWPVWTILRAKSKRWGYIDSGLWRSRMGLRRPRSVSTKRPVQRCNLFSLIGKIYDSRPNPHSWSWEGHYS